MYKSRLYSGNILFLLGAFPALYVLYGITFDEAAAQAGVVGLFIFFALGPFLAFGSLLSVSAVLRLTNLKQIKAAKLHSPIGTISIALGWLIALLVCMILVGVAIALLR